MTGSILVRPRPVTRLGVAVAVALVARLAFALLYWVDAPVTIDQREYLMLADNLRTGSGLTYGADEPRLMRSPGYPVFLAAVLSLGGSQTAVQVVQCGLGALSILIVAALARRLAGPRAALVAGWTAALYPPLVWMPAYLYSETQFTLLTLLAAWLFWVQLDRLRRAEPRRRTTAGPW